MYQWNDIFSKICFVKIFRCFARYSLKIGTVLRSTISIKVNVYPRNKCAIILYVWMFSVGTTNWAVQSPYVLIAFNWAVEENKNAHRHCKMHENITSFYYSIGRKPATSQQTHTYMQARTLTTARSTVPIIYSSKLKRNGHILFLSKSINFN